MIDGPEPRFADWRDDTLYERLRGIDRTGLMWEWLRRDPDYVAWYQHAAAHNADADPVRWGVHFR